MKRIFKGTVVLGVLLFCLSSAQANSIASKKNSNYGEPIAYTPVTNLSDLSPGTLVVDPAAPAGFNEEILCPFSSGCEVGAEPEEADFALFVETIGPLTPGEQFTLDLGAGATIDAVSLITCDPTEVSGTFCMPAAPSSGCDYNYTPAPDNASVAISLPNSAACTSSQLVFSIDEDVAAGSSPSFASVPVGTPETDSLVLLVAGLLSIVCLSARQRGKQQHYEASRA
jgi:hypothetical protein